MDMIEAATLLHRIRKYDLHSTWDFAQAAAETAEVMTDRDQLNAELGQMLRELADTGWKPLLYFEDGSNAARPGYVPPVSPMGWIAYPQAEVRNWRSFRADDPVGAVRQLYQHAREHPNVRPVPPPALAEPAQGPAECPPADAVVADRRVNGVTPPQPELVFEGPRPERKSHEVVRLGAAMACVGVLYLLALLGGDAIASAVRGVLP